LPKDVLYNGYQVGGGYSDSTYRNLYSGPRIADYLAIGRGPPAATGPGRRFGVYTDPQNHNSFTGSLYQALAPALVVPEHSMAPDSLGLNNRNTALAHGAYGAFGAHSPTW
jgi:hypothetical protein